MTTQPASCAPRGEPAIDTSGLLVALVLVPESYPRNRFFELYRQPAARRVRRRAALIRGIIAELRGGVAELTVERKGQVSTLRYRLPDVGVSRLSRLDEDELAVLTIALERSGDAGVLRDVDTGAMDRILRHLANLFPEA